MRWSKFKIIKKFTLEFPKENEPDFEVNYYKKSY